MVFTAFLSKQVVQSGREFSAFASKMFRKFGLSQAITPVSETINEMFFFKKSVLLQGSAIFLKKTTF